MNEEVKKAINYIQDSFKATIIHKENFEIVLNYIDKLQKENEELKEELQYYKDNIIEDLENRDRWE